MSVLLGGLRYIAKSQMASGGFQSFRLGEPNVSHPKRYRTTFIPSLIALALQEVPNSSGIREKIQNFLIAQKSDEWSWNYWDRASASTLTMPYPDDLDDTFLALAALWQIDQKMFTPNVMAYIANLLFAAEQQPGGPYKTWLVGEDTDKIWHDTDFVVNSNVAYFLALQKVELPELVVFVEEAIQSKKLTSPYYPDIQPAAYFTARWYKGGCVGQLQDQVLATYSGGHWATPHDTALGVTTLLRLGYPPRQLNEAIKYLKTTQRQSGGWPAGPICSDTIRPGETVKYFMGCSSLTTALCIEALHLHEMALTVSKAKKKPEAAHYKAVTDEVGLVIKLLHQPDLRRRTKLLFNQIIESDQDKQIVLLPWLVAKAFNVKPKEQLLHQLARVSIWGWMAYTIFDDFLDNEGEPITLPSAVMAHRQLSLTLSDTLPGDAGFQAEVREIMNQLDGANAWEVSHCRGTLEGERFLIAALPDYGDYWQLADRSLGHTIAGVGVLYGSRLRSGAIEITQLKKFFHHYLIARQLNDDAHDWEEDLAKGHVNAVAVMILKQWITAGHTLSEGIHLQNDKKELRLIMWQTVIDKVCRDIHKHVLLAKEALRHPELSIQHDLLFAALQPLEEAAHRALETRDEALEFIASL